MAQWYWAQDGQKCGPVEDAGLRQLAAKEQLRPTDMIWREGLPNWVPAGNVKGLFPPQGQTAASAAATLPAAAARTANPATNPPPAWAAVSKVQVDYAKQAGLPVARELNLGEGATLKMVLIPPGDFLMGSNDSFAELVCIYGEPSYCDCERPSHEIRITTPFYMGVTAVTQGEYVACNGQDPESFHRAVRPPTRQPAGGEYVLERRDRVRQESIAEGGRSRPAADGGGMGICVPGRDIEPVLVRGFRK